MFLIRSAFLLALLVMLLPSDPKEQAKFYQTASHVVGQAVTFCDRNEAICTKAEAHWTVFQQKFAVGARMVTALVSERLYGTPARTGESLFPPATAPVSDTLTPADRAPRWRERQRAQL